MLPTVVAGLGGRAVSAAKVSARARGVPRGDEGRSVIAFHDGIEHGLWWGVGVLVIVLGALLWTMMLERKR